MKFKLSSLSAYVKPEAHLIQQTIHGGLGEAGHLRALAVMFSDRASLQLVSHCLERSDHVWDLVSDGVIRP
jgi:hypothetical protein